MEAELVLSLFIGLSEPEMQLMLAELKELYPVAVETLGWSDGHDHYLHVL